MEVIGIIAEYNPFHNGHQYMLQQLRQQHPQAGIVVIMSGSCTQRGDVAVLNKWQRAASAVAGGASLVIELPFVFAARSAQYFAQGGIQLLNRLNCVNYLAFGAETDNLPLLQELAHAVELPLVKELLRKGLQAGMSYAAALGSAITAVMPESRATINEPNNILAMEYLRALKTTFSSLQPVTVKRQAASYHCETIMGRIASATALRRAMQQGELELVLQAVPPASASYIRSALAQGLPQENTLLPPLQLQLRLANAEGLQELYGINEGLENTLSRCASQEGVTDLAEFCHLVKSKRYAFARIKRTLLYILLHLTREKVVKFTKEGPLYARILAFNSQGRKLLQEIKAKGDIPLVDRPAKVLKDMSLHGSALVEMLTFDIKATELRDFCLPGRPPAAEEYTQPPVFVRDVSLNQPPLFEHFPEG